MTGCERVLRLLSDRQPHTHHEIYALNVIGHSRVSELRKRGHEIAQWRDGDDYIYQLVSSGPVSYGTVETPQSSPAAGPDSVQLLLLEWREKSAEAREERRSYEAQWLAAAERGVA